MAALFLLRPRAAGIGAPGLGGDLANVEAAQEAFLHRARMNALTRSQATGAPEMEQAVPA